MEPSPMVVDVLALLAFCCDGAATLRAGQKAHERVTLLGVAYPRFPVQGRLHLVEQRARDQRLVRALVAFLEPDELAVVDGVLQEPMDVRFEETSVRSGSR